MNEIGDLNQSLFWTNIEYQIIFHSKADGSRIYKVGNRKVTMNKNVLDKFKTWSTFPFCKNMKYDEQLVEALIISCVTLESLQAAIPIDDCVMQFIKSLYKYKNKIDSIIEF